MLNTKDWLPDKKVYMAFTSSILKKKIACNKRNSFRLRMTSPQNKGWPLIIARCQNSSCSRCERAQLHHSVSSFLFLWLQQEQTQRRLHTLDYFTRRLNLPPKKEEGKGGWEPNFALNLRLNFRVLIRPYWPGQVHSLRKGIEVDLCYKNRIIRGCKGLVRELGNSISLMRGFTLILVSLLRDSILFL